MAYHLASTHQVHSFPSDLFMFHTISHVIHIHPPFPKVSQLTRDLLLAAAAEVGVLLPVLLVGL